MILDTCSLLWLAHNCERLSILVVEEINNCPAVYISSVSGFEIGYKFKSGKLKLPVLPSEWFAQIIDHHNLLIIDLNLEICIAAAELPLIHKDPCDRFIIATALLKNLPVVTADKRFAEYGVKTLI